jgi:hypothetical protein
MATTTNNGWTTPNDTDLVRNGASAIRSLGTAIDSSLGKATYTNTTPTSTGTGWVLGTGNSASANWCQLGKTVFFDGIIQFGTSAAAGSGTLSIDLPVNASTNTTEWVGNGLFYDASASDYYKCTIRITGTDLEFWIERKLTTSSVDYVGLVAFNNTNKPVTIASGDQIIWSITYQGA